ncbi:MAG: phosphoribosylformylglycinamidine synthase subunit PurS [Rickettsiales bacterium]|nr:phosphoribosylformylglycinamidine synthase subunit PurS [Rickettsiales bacterium]
MKAEVYITLKNGVLDPQGKATQNSLEHLGFGNVQSVRQGKFIEVEIDAADVPSAETQLKDMCEKLLANTVIENYSFKILEEAA